MKNAALLIIELGWCALISLLTSAPFDVPSLTGWQATSLCAGTIGLALWGWVVIEIVASVVAAKTVIIES